MLHRTRVRLYSPSLRATRTSHYSPQGDEHRVGDGIHSPLGWDEAKKREKTRSWWAQRESRLMRKNKPACQVAGGMLGFVCISECFACKCKSLLYRWMCGRSGGSRAAPGAI